LRPILNPYGDAFQSGVPSSARKPMLWAYSWGIPSLEAIHAIADLGPIVELGAGTGYWAWLLKQAGADILCLDSNPESPPHWYPVRQGGARHLASHQDRTLLMVWPPLAGREESCMAYEALQFWRGSQLVYVGEWRGRTASPQFHDHLEANFKKTLELPLPRWAGFSDSLFILRANP